MMGLQLSPHDRRKESFRNLFSPAENAAPALDAPPARRGVPPSAARDWLGPRSLLGGVDVRDLRGAKEHNLGGVITPSENNDEG